MKILRRIGNHGMAAWIGRSPVSGFADEPRSLGSLSPYLPPLGIKMKRTTAEASGSEAVAIIGSAPRTVNQSHSFRNLEFILLRLRFSGNSRVHLPVHSKPNLPVSGQSGCFQDWHDNCNQSGWLCGALLCRIQRLPQCRGIQLQESDVPKDGARRLSTAPTRGIFRRP